MRETINKLRFGTALVVLALSCSIRSELTPKWRVITESAKNHSVSFDSVVFFDSLTGLALTGLSLEKSTDGGKTWTSTLPYNSSKGLDSMFFVNRKNGWIVGSENKNASASVASPDNHKPLILKTEDGGATWAQVNIEETRLGKDHMRFSVFSSLCVDTAGKFWVVGDAGLIEGTIEQETFEVTNVIFTESPLNNVLCGGSGEVWAVGDNGLVMHFQNTWATQYLNKEAFFMRVKAVGDDVWLIGGVRSRKQIQPEGLLLRSRNRQDWRDETPPSRGAFSDMYLTGGEGWLVGAGGSIFHTSDEGHTWKPVQSPTDSDLLSIFFINRSQGWISGSRLTILALGAN